MLVDLFKRFILHSFSSSFVLPNFLIPDCCAEKGALQCGAAARLRARARRRGWRVHVADLHWRSPLEQQRDHRFPVLCIAELAR